MGKNYRDGGDNGFMSIEGFLNEVWMSSEIDFADAKPELDESVGCMENSHEGNSWRNFSGRHGVLDNVRDDAEKVLEILQQDGPGFDAKVALGDLQIRVSGLLVREVLLGILRTINYANKSRWAKLGYKFFVWSGEQENYRHTTNAYHLIMKIFADAEEFKAMWRLVDEMIEKGFPTIARTFNILICACGEAGLAKKVPFLL